MEQLAVTGTRWQIARATVKDTKTEEVTEQTVLVFVEPCGVLPDGEPVYKLYQFPFPDEEAKKMGHALVSGEEAEQEEEAKPDITVARRMPTEQEVAQVSRVVGGVDKHRETKQSAAKMPGMGADHPPVVPEKEPGS